ncbi:hypothetical protein M8Z33_07485 [Streptomyces sp. ZAF1911]|uniref:hypothetical protein n=1 Tax=Streptomyces sp. ZAF1911 TaxID=2944129 RepID=UPI00237C21BB|nr:hypothetical protein [Streptomyces sp. ZAF1911]MDD9376516.1 hypothetical protein [Streptomyces sp. ZAF1911]
MQTKSAEILVLDMVAYPGNTKPEDYANRQCNGWAEWMPDDVTFTLNRWHWKVSSKRASQCPYVLFTYGGVVRTVAMLVGLDGPFPEYDQKGQPAERWAVRGEVVLPGAKDPVYERWHGKPRPEGLENRTPVNYVTMQV